MNPFTKLLTIPLVSTLVSIGPMSGFGFAAEVWHFLDAWHFHKLDGLELCQGQPVWLKDKTFLDPVREDLDAQLNSWTTVWRDEASGKWRMVYSAKWRPATLLVAENENGLDWRPLPCPDIQPDGGKIAPNHVFTLIDGSVGGAYVDPEAKDGYRFKMFAHRMGKAVIEDARRDPKHPQHEEASQPEPFEHLADELTLVSKDGLHWNARHDYDWGKRAWHPEPPLFGFWHEQEKRHFMSVRPGWGDRRVCLQDTLDFKSWSGPQPLLQPDPQDGLVEFYGMPVFRYGETYVGLLWVFHCETSEPPTGFNRFVGSLDTHLAYSYDGRHFQRGLRRPLIGLNDPGEIGGGAIETSCMVETDTELRFYSDATSGQHGGKPKHSAGGQPTTGLIIHSLRKDGLTYLRALGGWGSFISKPLTLFEPRLTVNLLAPQGEAVFQLSDEQGKPLPGFSFANCETVANVDDLNLALRWKDKSLAEVLKQPIRLEARLRNGHLYAVRGKFHFLDAEDSRRLQLGKPIDPLWFDY
ncbi:MAG: hypothetical protein H6821_00825 [Planctomycetaceae bacterium]|nr:hypothetical protein [Planctomycetales bacterium]MCB9872694.1 hypothetical protein [Planctomycetaceae bacterium]MCB9926180.1 hypothetical protein [Planctomycetaceae bacterium]